MIDRPAILAVGSLLLAAGLCQVLPDADAHRLLVEGGLVETLSAMAAAGSCVGLLRVLVIERARRRGETVNTPATLMRDAVVLTLVGVFFAGEELSWGDGVYWDASFVAGRRFDAAHDVVSMVADGAMARALAVFFVGCGFAALAARRWLRRPTARWLVLSAAFYAAALALDTLHVPGNLALSLEELSELWGAGLLLTAAALVDRRAS